MMTPLGSEGGVHETVSCTIPEVADKPDTGPGTVYMYTRSFYVYVVCVYIYIINYLYMLHAYMYSAAKDKQLS